MTLRYARVVLVGLLLLQGSLFAPAAMTLDAGQAADCAEHMGSADRGCPCCPPDVTMSAGCLAMCLGVFAETVSFAGVISHEAGIPGLELPPTFLASQTYTPVNPPPIA